jgi:peptidoglycan/LPS O-acetylase OafA/YrhL
LPRWGGWIEHLMRTSPVGESAGIFLAVATFLSTTHIVYEAASIGVVIACLVYGPELRWFHWLDLMWLRSVGRVSYSFYLFHLIILYCLARVAVGVSSTWVAYLPPIAMNVLLASISILVAILLAQLMFVWIETPFMTLGKQLSQRLIGISAPPHLHRSKDGVA